MTTPAMPDRTVRAAPATRPRGVVLLPLPELRGLVPMDVAEAFRDLPGLVLLESARPGRTGRWSFLSADPVAVLEAPADGPDPLADARRLLRRMEAGAAPTMAGPEGRQRGGASPGVPPFLGGLAGYLSYDLGRRLERIPDLAAVDQQLPLLRLALHDWVVAWDRSTGDAWLGGRAVDGDEDRLRGRIDAVRQRLAGVARSEAGADPASVVRAAAPSSAPSSALSPAPSSAPSPAASSAPSPAPTGFVSGLTKRAWIDRVEAIRTAIADGQIYQANLTRRLAAPFDGDPWPLFRRLRTGDPALFAAFLDLGPDPVSGASRALLSASPEPFLSAAPDGRVATDPIKGTRPRGRTRAEDRALARELLASGKDQAENVMIVDVLRNDLGRVCEPGSVRVPRLCRLERTAAVQHLVTTVTGQLRPGLDPLHLLASSFPGGSITGAPKIRAIQLIETLEPVRRGPYTGALGWVGPDGGMGTSIIIRTFVADGARLSLHVGGGITWRSDPEAEWDETVAKARGPLGAIGAHEVEA